MIELEAAPPYGLVHKGPCLSSKGMTDSDNWDKAEIICQMEGLKAGATLNLDPD